MNKLKTPTTYPISQFFGENATKHYKEMGMKGHNGIDFACPTGTPIVSCLDGIVEYVGQDSAGGIGVYVIHEKEKLKSIYWHFKDYVVKVGDKVKKGDVLGISDNTGLSTGPHLHFGLKKVEKKGKIWRNVDDDNGYNGSIDPFFMFEDVYKNINGVFKSSKYSKGTWIKYIQEALVRKGYVLVIDGIFGKQTLAEVKKFQSDNGLIPDGIVGKKTWEMLLK